MGNESEEYRARALLTSLELCDQTLDAAETLMINGKYDKAAIELTSVWDYRYAGAQKQCRTENESAMLNLRLARHKKLMCQLNRRAGLIKRILRRIL